jgi:hypothetical protein
MRHLSEGELQAGTCMMRAKLAGGEDPDDVEADVIRYLLARGWRSTPASRRVHELMLLVVAERDDVAGAVPSR